MILFNLWHWMGVASLLALAACGGGGGSEVTNRQNMDGIWSGTVSSGTLQSDVVGYIDGVDDDQERDLYLAIQPAGFSPGYSQLAVLHGRVRFEATSVISPQITYFSSEAGSYIPNLSLTGKVESRQGAARPDSIHGVISRSIDSAGAGGQKVDLALNYSALNSTGATLANLKGTYAGDLQQGVSWMLAAESDGRLQGKVAGCLVDGWAEPRKAAGAGSSVSAFYDVDLKLSKPADGCEFEWAPQRGVAFLKYDSSGNKTGLWVLPRRSSSLNIYVLDGVKLSDEAIVPFQTPSRFIAFGDGLSDLGQSGSRYTVNDGSVNVWTQQVAGSYGGTLVTQASGGTSYARGHARIVGTPDDVNGSTLTVAQQVDKFLASDKFGVNDVVLLNGGLSDLLFNYNANSSNLFSFAAAMTQAGTDLGTQVRRLVTAGAKYVVVSGLYDVSSSPWGVGTGQAQASMISYGVFEFNSALQRAINDLGANVLFINAAYYYNLVIASPSSYSLSDSTNIACTSTDSGAGIGIGNGQVNSSLCTTSTLASGVDYTKYTFADKLYFTPAAQALYGAYVYGRMRSTW